MQGTSSCRDGSVLSCRPLAGDIVMERTSMTPRWLTPGVGTPGLQSAPQGLQRPFTCPQHARCLLPPRAILPQFLLLPLLTSDVSMEFLASLTFLAPHPQSLPTSSFGICPELQRAQPPLESTTAPSPPARDRGPGTQKHVLAPCSEHRVWPCAPIPEPRDSPRFFNMPSPLFLSSSNHTLFDRSLAVPRCWEPPSAVTTWRWGGGACALLGVA